MNMKENINRREFLKQAGAGTAAVGAVALAGACAPKKTAEAILDDGSSEDVPENGKMEMRENPGNGGHGFPAGLRMYALHDEEGRER